MIADLLITARLHEIAKPARTGFAQMRQEPPAPAALHGLSLYHGVGREDHAQSILRSGTLNPGTKTGNEWLTPIPGRVYLAQSPGAAAAHALDRIPDGGRVSDLKRGYGYVFRVDGSSLQHAMADEDSIGHLAGHTQGRPNGPSWLETLVQRHMTKSALDDRDAAPDWPRNVKHTARVGKILSPHLTPEQHHELIVHHGAHVAHPGPIKISGAWRIDRSPRKNNMYGAAKEWRDKLGGYHYTKVLDAAEPIHHLIGKG